MVGNVPQGVLTEKHVQDLLSINIGAHFKEWLNHDEIRMIIEELQKVREQKKNISEE